MTTPTLSEGLAHAANEVAAGVGGPVGSLMLAAWSVRAAALESERDALRAEVVRLREALHPGPMPEWVRREAGGLWWFRFSGPDIGQRDWAREANRYETLTGLDAMTGEKR